MLSEFYGFLDGIAEKAAKQVDQDPQNKTLTEKQWAAKVADVSTEIVVDALRELNKTDPQRAAWISVQIKMGLEMDREYHENNSAR